MLKHNVVISHIINLAFTIMVNINKVSHDSTASISESRVYVLALLLQTDILYLYLM